MRVHKMTKWDAGNELVAATDELADRERDLRQSGYFEMADLLRACRLSIGKRFNELGTHGFRLPESPLTAKTTKQTTERKDV